MDKLNLSSCIIRNCFDFISSINSNIFLLLLSACILDCISCLHQLEAGIPCSFLSILRGGDESCHSNSGTPPSWRY